jgi:hypothetical protein
VSRSGTNRASCAICVIGTSIATRPSRRLEDPPDDGLPRILQVTTSTSTVIGGEDEGYIVTTGVLLGVDVRLARPDEIEASELGLK